MATTCGPSGPRLRPGDRPKDAFGAHRYSLADTGLDAAEERGRFGPYQRRYDVPDEV